MGAMIDLINKRFTNLVVMIRSIHKNKHGDVCWICRCDCGQEIVVPSGDLRSGNTKSCGCYRTVDLVNHKFGRLTALKKTEKRDGSGNVIWCCLCECGNETLVTSHSLLSGNTKSCGCYIASGLDFPWLAGRNSIIRGYVRRAKKGKLQFDLSYENCDRIFKGNCFYCGIEPYNISNPYLTKNNITTVSGSKLKDTFNFRASDYIYNGIDRQHNNLGYFSSNCVSCCKRCNMAKSDMTYNEWETYMARLIAFNKDRVFIKADEINTHADTQQQPSFNKLVNLYKRSAYKRNIPFKLSILDCQELFKGNCNYCGVKPINTINVYLTKNMKISAKFRSSFDLTKATYTYNGIDRVNPSLGYFRITNDVIQCVSCCKPCNRAKSNMSIEDFNAWIIRVSNLGNKNVN